MHIMVCSDCRKYKFDFCQAYSFSATALSLNWGNWGKMKHTHIQTSFNFASYTKKIPKRIHIFSLTKPCKKIFHLSSIVWKFVRFVVIIIFRKNILIHVYLDVIWIRCALFRLPKFEWKRACFNVNLPIYICIRKQK